jgi:hypothetical protein
MDKKIRSPLGDIANPFTLHEGIFSNVEEAKFAIRGVLRAYFGNDSDGEDDYLFFKASVVRFEENPQVDLEFDHRKRTIIFVVKEPHGKDAETIKAQIRNQISMQYAVLASDSRGRTAMSIFRALEPEAKKEIIEKERQKEKKDGTSI